MQEQKEVCPMHINKTAQDRMPVTERPRVHAWAARMLMMQGKPANSKAVEAYVNEIHG